MQSPHPPFGYTTDVPVDEIAMDNGERMIRMRIAYGPLWANADGDDLLS